MNKQEHKTSRNHYTNKNRYLKQPLWDPVGKLPNAYADIPAVKVLACLGPVTERAGSVQPTEAQHEGR